MPSSPAMLAAMRRNTPSSTTKTSPSPVGQMHTAGSGNIGTMKSEAGSQITPGSVPIATMGVMRQSEAMHSPAVSATSRSPPKPPILQRTKFVIKGKVQGVYFRKFTQQKAVELGIFGTVRNEEDGTVTGEAEGRIGNMNDFKLWLSTKGSPKSKVEAADFIDEPDVQGRKYERFDIDRTS
jgi:acylphosphatase